MIHCQTSKRFFCLGFFLILALINSKESTASAAKKPESSSSNSNAGLPTTIGYPGEEELEYLPGQLLVAFKSKTAAKNREQLMKKYHGVQKTELAGGTLYLIQFPEDSNLKELSAKIESEEGVRYAEPNLMMRTFPGKIPSNGPSPK